jgi:hypothetical protein
VQHSREAARQTQCRNNLKQVGLALHTYHDSHGTLPPGSTSDVETGVWVSGAQRFPLHSWASMILPELDQANLFRSIDFNVSSLEAANRDVAGTVLAVYRCPSYSGPAHSTDPLYQQLGRYALRNYVAMGATDIGKLWKNPDGVIYARSSIRFRDVKDGTSNTIFIAETRETGAAVWIDGGAASLAARRFDASHTVSYAGPETSINYTPYYWTERDMAGNKSYDSIDCVYGPSSFHGAGSFHLYGDGGVRFLTQHTDAALYTALCSRAGKEITADSGP